MHAESSKRWWRILTIVIPFLALTGCGEGDGPTSIPNSAVAPLNLPAGFCDPINFELECEPPGIIWFGGGQTIIVENPDKSGINQSDSVGRMQKFGDQVFGGTRLNPVEVPIDFSAGEAYKIKVWSERPVPVLFKLEETNDGTLGVDRTATHNGGSVWEELCFDFNGVTPANTIGLTIIFDNGVLGAAIGGIFSGDWTFYYDDITQVESCSDVPPTGIAPDVSLYDPAGTPQIPADIDVTVFGSLSVIDQVYAVDETYMPVLAVSSGVGYDANIAQIGFTGGDRGFLSEFESLDFKVKGLPNNVIFVKLFDGVDSLRINLTSSAYADELTDGWYQVSIPVSAFNGVSLATGIVFESDNTAPMQFTMLLTDIGFTEGDDGGDGGDCDDGGAPDPNAVVFDDDFGAGVSFAPFGGSINDVSVDATEPYSGTASLKVVVPGAEYTGGALVADPARDLSAYDTLTFWAKASDARTLNVAGIANDTSETIPNAYEVNGLALTTTWTQYTITIPDPSVLTANTGLFHFAEGSDEGPYTIWFDDITYEVSGGGECDGGDGGDGGVATLGIFSETNTDPFVTYVLDIASAGNPVGIDAVSTAVTPFDGTVSLALSFSDNTEGNFFGGAVFNFEEEDLSAYDTLKFSIDTSAYTAFSTMLVQLELPTGGADGTFVTLADYTAVATSGNWDTYEIPLADFTAINPAAVIRLGFWNVRNADGDLIAGTLYLDDIHFTTASGGGNGGNGGGPVEGDLAVNGGFETGGFDNWEQFENSGAQSISSDTPADGGSFSAALSANTVVGAGGTTEIKQANLGAGGGVVLGDVLTIQFDVKGTFGPAGQLNVLSFTEFGGGGGTLSDQQVINSGVEDWTRFNYDVTLGGPDADGGFSLAFNPVCGAVEGCFADVLIDNVSIVLN